MPWVRGRNFQKGSRGNLGEVEVAPYVLQYGGNMTVKIHENQPLLCVDFVFFGHFEPFWAQKHQKTKKQHVELASIVASYHPLPLPV